MIATMKSTKMKPRQLMLYVNHLAHFASKTDISTIANSMKKNMTSTEAEIQFVTTVINKDTSIKSAQKSIRTYNPSL